MRKPWIPKRTLWVMGIFLLAIILDMDRSCISIAEGDIISGLQLTEKQWGWIVSAFAMEYAFFQVPAGAMSDRLCRWMLRDGKLQANALD